MGCFTGSFLNCFDSSWTKFGVEPSKKAALIASKNEIDILGKSVPLSSSAITFDVIVSLNVVEHIIDVGKYLNHLKSMLNDNGIIFIETGDYQCFFPRFMGVVGLTITYLSMLLFFVKIYN